MYGLSVSSYIKASTLAVAIRFRKGPRHNVRGICLAFAITNINTSSERLNITDGNIKKIKRRIDLHHDLSRLLLCAYPLPFSRQGRKIKLCKNCWAFKNNF